MNIKGIYIISSILKPERVYIGSAVNIKSRLSGHVCSLKKIKHHSILLQRHFNKYGLNDLKFETLEEVLAKENLLITEQKFLDQLNPYFNTNKTAGSNLGCKFGPHTDEHKKKISDGNKGKKVSQASIEMHEVKMHKYSLDGRLIKTYRSGIAAQKAEGILIRNSNQINLTIGGHVWVSENSKLPDFKAIQKRLNECRKVLCRPVLQIDKNGVLVNEFEGVRIAYKITGIDHRSIAQVAGGSKVRKTAGGFFWKYKTENHVA